MRKTNDYGKAKVFYDYKDLVDFMYGYKKSFGTFFDAVEKNGWVVEIRGGWLKA